MKEQLDFLLEKGFFLFPLSPKSKVPLIKRNWKEISTNERQQIYKWLQELPNCNWAVDCLKSNIVVIDVDIKHDGIRKWSKICSKNNGEPKTMKIRSGSGGFHYYFKAQPGVQYKGMIEKGIDIKHNGYVVAPGSTHPNGGKYEII